MSPRCLARAKTHPHMQADSRRLVRNAMLMVSTWPKAGGGGGAWVPLRLVLLSATRLQTNHEGSIRLTHSLGHTSERRS